MPYIKRTRARELDVLEHAPRNPAELNYLISKLLAGYVEEGVSYALINDVQGALKCASAEFERRVTVPYEAIKLREAQVGPGGAPGLVPLRADPYEHVVLDTTQAGWNVG